MPYADKEKQLAYFREYGKRYRKISTVYKKWAEASREKRLKYLKEYREKNPFKSIKHKKDYYEKNKKEIIRRLQERYNQKYHSDLEFKITCALRRRVLTALKNNSKHKPAIDLLGCSIASLKSHLESKFKPGMTWENYGIKGWHIDHIRPCASFNLTKPEEQNKCFHYTNLQPLWAKENYSKGVKYSL